MAKKRTTPKRRGVARVPIVMQQETFECGAACLAMVMAYYGLYIPLEKVRKECGVSRDGSTLKSVYMVAQKHGFGTRAFRYEPETLRRKGIFPCIVHWDFNHFVVVNGFRGDRVIINDPAHGTVNLSLEEFDRSFTGICLMLEPTEEFKPCGKPESILAFARERLRGTSKMLWLIILTTLITSLIGILNPAFSRFFVDRMLMNGYFEWRGLFFFALVVTGAMQLTAAWVKAVYLLKLQGKMAIVANTSFVWHILRLPLEFYGQRMAGDIVARQESNQEIANTLLSTLAPMALDFGTMLLYFILMLRYSTPLAAVGFISVIANLVLSRVIAKRRVNITRVQMHDAGKLNGLTISGIDMIETIKAAGAEEGFFSQWAGYHASYNDQVVKYSKLDQYLGQLPALISLLTGNVVLYIGVTLIMRGEWTIGLVMAFNGYLSAFSAPATSLLAAGQSFEEMRASMERVQDVLKCEPDVDYVKNEQTEDYKKLSGELELKNVTFGYNELRPPLIEDFSLKIKRGENIAIVGGSGSGKSTLCNLITGLYKPWSGEILFDSKPASEYSRGVFTASVACVDQDIILFEDTIANNIKMWDNSIEDFEMKLAAWDAKLNDMVMQREGGYQYVLSDGGRDISGGQRQRIEIARALAQEPAILVLDEATSALDSQTENEIMRSIADRGITRIIVSHRISIIRDCDKIIVLQNGKVTDSGTHDELMKRCSFYVDLVTRE